MKKLPFLPRAILFDMDGVIVDSMPYHFIAWYEALRPYGVRVSCFDVYSREGERWDKSLTSFLGLHGIRPDASTLNKISVLRRHIFKKYFKRFIFKGAAEFLSCLRAKGYFLGLVSGTPTHEIKRILPLRIRSNFDVVIAGNNVKHGKPHPEPYLKAARALGVRPRDCVVVENAPLGIRSAKKAGMYCIAITTSLPRPYLKAADIVVDEFADIFALIERSCRR